MKIDITTAFATFALILLACTPARKPASAQAASAPPPPPTTTTTPATTGTATPGTTATPTAQAPAAQPCSEPEHRQMDFWIGDWDVTIRARASLDSDQWAEAKGTNHVVAILNGCVIEESFRAPGPGTPWAGRSVSQRVAQDGKWHQTWVDDQGAYMTFVGEKVGAEMVLMGVPRALPSGVTQQMRMVFTDITGDALKWRWEGTRDGGKTWATAMTIAYARKR